MELSPGKTLLHPDDDLLMPRAVLFDLDDTLFDHRHCAKAALHGVRGTHPALLSAPDALLERAHAEILEGLHLDVLAGRLTIDNARVERFRRLYARVGWDADRDLAGATAAAYRAAYVASRREIAGATRLLEAVRPHAGVVIVSNNVVEEQREKLRTCRLDRLVDVLVVSEEAGMSKPDPRIFQIALDRAGVVAARAVMVGDSWTNDVEGARAAGIRAVWFNRDGLPPRDPQVPVIRSLDPAEALPLIFPE